MAIEEKTSPWELLFRFDPLTGQLGGAHFQDALVIVRDGQVASVTPGAPVPVALAAGAPGLPIADLLGATLTAALGRADEEAARAAAAEAALAAAREEISSLGAALVAAREEISSLGVALAAAQEVVDPIAVPASVTAFQARAALLAAGLLDEVEAAVAAADRLTQTAWEYALRFERVSPTIAALAAALGLGDAELDDLFRAAAKISA